MKWKQKMTKESFNCKNFGRCIYSICPCDKWEFNGANDELLLLEIERLRQMLEMASVDISKFINCSPNDYLHDLSTRDYYEDIKENE